MVFPQQAGFDFVTRCLFFCGVIKNMIDGLGITGYEGTYMRVSEITLSILRAHKETLMSVLETFIHDPLVEWTKSHKSSGVEVKNPHAQVCISLP